MELTKLWQEKVYYFDIIYLNKERIIKIHFINNEFSQVTFDLDDPMNKGRREKWKIFGEIEANIAKIEAEISETAIQTDK